MADHIVTVGGPERDPRRRKRRTRLTAVVAVAAALAAVGRLWLVPQPGPERFGRSGTDEPAHAGVYPAAILARIPVSGVLSLIADGPSVWVIRVYGQMGVSTFYQLVKINELTNAVTLRVNLGSAMPAVAVGDGMVWLATGHGQASGQLIRIDPTTGRVIVTVHLAARACVLITFSGGNLWAECAVSNSRMEFVRVDPLTGRVTGRVGSVSAFTGPIAAVPGGIMYTDDSSNYWLIQAGQPSVRSIKVQVSQPPASYGSQQSMVYADGYVWALSHDESVIKADLASGRVLRAYGYRSYDPGHAGGLDYFTVGNGSLWFLDDGYPFNGVLRVSLATGRPLGAVAEPIIGDCGVAPCAQIYATPGAIWVPTTDSLIRIDPARMPG